LFVLSDLIDFAFAFADLVNETNKYLGDASCKALLLTKVTAFVGKILRVFGVMDQEAPGFAAQGAGGQSSEEVLAPILDAFTTFRAQIRQSARDKAAHETLLNLCDSVRDDVLPELGVRLEDKGTAASVWKLDDKNVLIRERNEKRQAARANAIKKVFFSCSTLAYHILLYRFVVLMQLASQLKAREVDLEKATGAAVPAREFLAAQTDKYSAFEAETGLPTHDKEGKELSKKNRQFAEKQMAKQTELNAWLQSQDASYLDNLRAEIERLTVDLAAAQL
jgi:cysteinyl-tRNA synthetase